MATNVGEPYADRVFLGGRVLTMAQPATAQAVAIQGGRIAAVGSSGEIAALAGPDTDMVHLHGRALIPGFVDPHTHFGMTCFEPVAVDCRIPPLRNKAAVLDAIGAAAGAAPPGQWILGLGYTSSRGVPPAQLLAADLDSVAPDNPVCVVDSAVHGAYANSAALLLARVSGATPDPVGGSYGRDDHGHPCGPLWERAYDTIYRLSSDALARVYGDEVMADLVRANCARFLALGITSVGDAAVTPEAAALFRVADRRGALTLTLHEMRTGPELLDEPDPADQRARRLSEPPTDRLRGGSMKMFIDPAFPRNAGYQFHHDGHIERLGVPFYEPAKANALAAEGAASGFQVAIHCLGTWANAIGLDALTAARRAAPGADHRHRIEHFTAATFSQIGAAAELGAIAVTQPSFFFATGEAARDRLGSANVDAPPMPLRRMLDEGLAVALSSDFPCGPLDPLAGVYSAISRHTRAGSEIAPEQAVSAAEALRLYTLAGAHAMHRDQEVGTIEVGKRADLVVLSHDPTNADEMRFREIAVQQTYVDGECVYALWPRTATAVPASR